jgi:hypothetical protein
MLVTLMVTGLPSGSVTPRMLIGTNLWFGGQICEGLVVGLGAGPFS